jgi:hypothetical protein
MLINFNALCFTVCSLSLYWYPLYSLIKLEAVKSYTPLAMPIKDLKASFLQLPVFWKLLLNPPSSS